MSLGEMKTKTEKPIKKKGKMVEAKRKAAISGCLKRSHM